MSVIAKNHFLNFSRERREEKSGEKRGEAVMFIRIHCRRYGTRRKERDGRCDILVFPVACGFSGEREADKVAS